MSTLRCVRLAVFSIPFQLFVALSAAMSFHGDPYVSKFDYDPKSHPSRNPNCPMRWEQEKWEERRSPDEGSPVGEEPSIEIRAVLVRCPRSNEETTELSMSEKPYNITAGRSKDILEFRGFDRDEPARHSEVKKCRRKLIVTMKLNNIGKTQTREEFVVVDHVLDPVTMQKARLLNPYVFKIRQEQVLQLYGLKFQSVSFQHVKYFDEFLPYRPCIIVPELTTWSWKLSLIDQVVNAEAKEEVINKDSANYTGCDDSTDNPTCGLMTYREKPVSYSQGFCCSCDPDVNAERQPKSDAVQTTGRFDPGSDDEGESNYESMEMFAKLFGHPRTSTAAGGHRRSQSRTGSREGKSPKNSGSAGQLRNAIDTMKAKVSDGKLESFPIPEKGRRTEAGGIIPFGGAKLGEVGVSGSKLYSGGLAELGSAVNSPTRGKMEAYIDTVISEALREASKELASGIGSVPAEAGKAPRLPGDGSRSVLEEFDRYDHWELANNGSSQEIRHRVSDVDSSAELLDLEREYERLNSRKQNQNIRFPEGRKDRARTSLPRRDQSIEDDAEQIKLEDPLFVDLSSEFENSGIKFPDLSPDLNPEEIASSSMLPSSSTGISTQPFSTSSSWIKRPSDETVAHESSTLSLTSHRSTANVVAFDESFMATPVRHKARVKSSTESPLILRQELVDDKLHPSSTTPVLLDIGGHGGLARAEWRTVTKSSASATPRLRNEFTNSATESSLEGSIKPIQTTTSVLNEIGLGNLSRNAKVSSLGQHGSPLNRSYPLKEQHADWVIKYAKLPPDEFDDSVSNHLNGPSAGIWSRDMSNEITDRISMDVQSPKYSEELLKKLEPFVATGSTSLKVVPLQAFLSVEEQIPKRLSPSENGIPEPVGSSEHLWPLNSKNDSHGKLVKHSDGLGFHEMSSHGGKNTGEKGRRLSMGSEKLNGTPNKVESLVRLSKTSSDEMFSEVRKSNHVRRSHVAKSELITSQERDVVPPLVVRNSDAKGTRSPSNEKHARSSENDTGVNLREARLDDLRQYLKTHLLKNSSLEAMAEEIEKALENNRFLHDKSMLQKLNAIEKFMGDNVDSWPRFLRSLSYDDPFERKNDEKQKQIDQKIENKFADIAKALNESRNEEDKINDGLHDSHLQASPTKTNGSTGASTSICPGILEKILSESTESSQDSPNDRDDSEPASSSQRIDEASNITGSTEAAVWTIKVGLQGIRLSEQARELELMQIVTASTAPNIFRFPQGERTSSTARSTIENPLIRSSSKFSKAEADRNSEYSSSSSISKIPAENVFAEEIASGNGSPKETRIRKSDVSVKPHSGVSNSYQMKRTRKLNMVLGHVESGMNSFGENADNEDVVVTGTEMKSKQRHSVPREVSISKKRRVSKKDSLPTNFQRRRREKLEDKHPRAAESSHLRPDEQLGDGWNQQKEDSRRSRSENSNETLHRASTIAASETRTVESVRQKRSEDGDEGEERVEVFYDYDPDLVGDGGHFLKIERVKRQPQLIHDVQICSTSIAPQLEKSSAERSPEQVEDSSKSMKTQRRAAHRYRRKKSHSGKRGSSDFRKIKSRSSETRNEELLPIEDESAGSLESQGSVKDSGIHNAKVSFTEFHAKDPEMILLSGSGKRRRVDDKLAEKWRQKLDSLKLKKHEDMLKEYLNWNPKIDGTMRKLEPRYHVSSSSGRSNAFARTSPVKSINPMTSDETASSANLKRILGSLSWPTIISMANASKDGVSDDFLLISLRKQPEISPLMGYDDHDSLFEQHKLDEDVEKAISPQLIDKNIRSAGTKKRSSRPVAKSRNNHGHRHRRRRLLSVQESLPSIRKAVKSKFRRTSLKESSQGNELESRNRAKLRLLSRDEPEEDAFAGTRGSTLDGDQQFADAKSKVRDLLRKTRGAKNLSRPDGSARNRLATGMLHLFDSDNEIAGEIEHLGSARGTTPNTTMSNSITEINNSGGMKNTARHSRMLSSLDANYGKKGIRADDTDSEAAVAMDEDDDDNVDENPANEEAIIENDAAARDDGPAEDRRMERREDAEDPNFWKNGHVIGDNPMKKFGGISDFQISLTGKVHIDGGIDGQPISLRIESANVTPIAGETGVLRPFVEPESNWKSPATDNSSIDLRLGDSEHLYFDDVDLKKILQGSIANSSDTGNSPSTGAGASKPASKSWEISRPFFDVFFKGQHRVLELPRITLREVANAPSGDGEPGRSSLRPFQKIDAANGYSNTDEHLFNYATLELRRRGVNGDGPKGSQNLPANFRIRSSVGVAENDSGSKNGHMLRRNLRRTRRHKNLAKTRVATADRRLKRGPRIDSPEKSESMESYVSIPVMELVKVEPVSPVRTEDELRLASPGGIPFSNRWQSGSSIGSGSPTVGSDLIAMTNADVEAPMEMNLLGKSVEAEKQRIADDGSKAMRENEDVEMTEKSYETGKDSDQTSIDADLNAGSEHLVGNSNTEALKEVLIPESSVIFVPSSSGSRDEGKIMAEKDVVAMTNLVKTFEDLVRQSSGGNSSQTGLADREGVVGVDNLLGLPDTNGPTGSSYANPRVIIDVGDAVMRNDSDAENTPANVSATRLEPKQRVEGPKNSPRPTDRVFLDVELPLVDQKKTSDTEKILENSERVNPLGLTGYILKKHTEATPQQVGYQSKNSPCRGHNAGRSDEDQHFLQASNPVLGLGNHAFSFTDASRIKVIALNPHVSPTGRNVPRPKNIPNDYILDSHLNPEAEEQELSSADNASWVESSDDSDTDGTNDSSNDAVSVTNDDEDQVIELDDEDQPSRIIVEPSTLQETQNGQFYVSRAHLSEPDDDYEDYNDDLRAGLKPHPKVRASSSPPKASMIATKLGARVSGNMQRLRSAVGEWRHGKMKRKAGALHKKHVGCKTVSKPDQEVQRNKEVANDDEDISENDEDDDNNAESESEEEAEEEKEEEQTNNEKTQRKKKKGKKVPENDDKRTAKKWWPFKRNLLSLAEDLEVLDTEAAEQSYSELRIDSKRAKRQIRSGGAQVRGGQNCLDKTHPPDVNPVKYQESAHCLRFSDLWYSVYELESPILEHTVYLQLFEKHTLQNGATHWEDLTRGSMVKLGTFVRHQRDAAPTIAFTYSGAKVSLEKQAGNLDPEKDRLLVPSPVSPRQSPKYSEFRGGSEEYLVVPSSAINKEGNECDKAGVGFASFAQQPNRCENPRGTCLKNQPLAYRKHDTEARASGRAGCYFLSNFASVPNNPIKYNVSSGGRREYLGLEYHSAHVSAIDVEATADYNSIVRVGSSGRITEVYADSTSGEHTILTIVVSNMGLASSPYQSRINDCPTGLPVAWSKARGPMQVVAPQHDQRVTLDLYGKLYLDDFHCSVEVVNHRGELVAMRRIRIRKADRCFCLWYCLCACFDGLMGLGCQPMSAEHYHAAGFQGPVPFGSVESSIMSEAFKDAMTYSGLIVLCLLILGMLKWIVGILVPAVGRGGLDLLLEGTEMSCYYEPELRCRSIVTNAEGRIVHPDSGGKTVRICNRRDEFLLNLTFFLCYPIAACRMNCCGDSSRRPEETRSSTDSQMCFADEETRPCPNLITVDTYGDDRDSLLEAEDTRYVIEELKRSRDSIEGSRTCEFGVRNRK